jgi:ACS family hexuronate transporter-like MFS transporter
MIAPLVIPAVVLFFFFFFAAFVWTFLVALFWIVFWLLLYSKPEQNKKVNNAELEHILSDNEETISEKISYAKLLSFRASWAIMIGKFVADPIWWFYLFWGAKYLYTKFGLNLSEIGLPFFTIYLVSWCGGICLGWLSSMLLRRGNNLNRGRKLSMLACAVCALPVMFVPYADHVWTAVALIAVAAGGHCGWSANMFSLMGDVFPKKITASVSGLGGFAGAIGGVFAPILIGMVLQDAGSEGYVIPFTRAAFGYIIALIIIHLLLPRIQPLKM